MSAGPVHRGRGGRVQSVIFNGAHMHVHICRCLPSTCLPSDSAWNTTNDLEFQGRDSLISNYNVCVCVCVSVHSPCSVNTISVNVNVRSIPLVSIVGNSNNLWHSNRLGGT